MAKPMGAPVDPYNTAPMHNGSGMMDQTLDGGYQKPLIEDGGPVPPGSGLAKEFQLGFYRKVFGIFSSQLILTMGIVAAMISIKPVQEFVAKNWPLFFAAFFIQAFASCFLTCSRWCARAVPINYILLFIFTVTEAYIV
jgi:hypothetical protein